MFNGFGPEYLIANFGKPDHVDIRPQGGVTMLYQEKHIFALYKVDMNTDINVFCFAGYDTLQLWSSNVDNLFPNVKSLNDHSLNISIMPGGDVCFPR